VRFNSLSIQDFRNMSLAKLSLEGDATFLLGGNGAGKTSLLEAMSLVGALRSFRTGDPRTMIRHGAKSARVVCGLVHEGEGASSVEIEIGHGVRSVRMDGNPLERVSDLVGRFPTVVLSSQDLLLVRGSPAARRRFLDMMLAGADRVYFEALRRYGRALISRNSLLKSRADPVEIAAFEKPLSEAAFVVCRARARALEELGAFVNATYSAIAPSNEVPCLVYRPDCEADSPDKLLEAFSRSRERDIARGSTSVGPHLDDFELRLCDKSAREYASEGQQRGLVLALRLAEAGWLRSRTRVEPVILADDIMGELDPARREAFWKILGGAAQVVATGTEIPAVESRAGRFRIARMEEIVRMSAA
jgi:DNA replication and repair protein RecF